MSEIKNLINAEAIAKLRQLAMDADVALFGTNVKSTPLTTRPMSTQDVDEQGNLWFMSRENSNKNKEIASDKRVELFYSNKGKSEYLSVYGNAEIVNDKNKIDQFWTPVLKAWFTEGKDDPAISLIKVKPAEAYYWDTKENKFIAFIKIAMDAIAGKESDNGVEGTLNIRN